jgi:hypothetical protein
MPFGKRGSRLMFESRAQGYPVWIQLMGAFCTVIMIRVLFFTGSSTRAANEIDVGAVSLRSLEFPVPANYILSWNTLCFPLLLQHFVSPLDRMPCILQAKAPSSLEHSFALSVPCLALSNTHLWLQRHSLSSI